MFFSRESEDAVNFRLHTGLQEPVKRYPYPKVYVLLKKTLPLPRFCARSGSAFSMCADFLLSESAPQIRSSPIYRSRFSHISDVIVRC
ncbi:uncharacterized protein EDB91DRAFT_1256435 [Suillus paluster]|uniref:uncharacterized protein n=1 Tax=Suillus paluster TaxID=48578 RepID=UPI001B880B11|nr:uncharacterized protein EDB91DRAFT_1256435 [Suillus paluster]KAG1721585.1 hypothetical protein EDB91DRAFT_1256435 [Suillus paluster]